MINRLASQGTAAALCIVAAERHECQLTLDGTAGRPDDGAQPDATLLATAQAVADLHAVQPSRIPRHWTGRDRLGRRCRFDAQERHFTLEKPAPEW